MSTDADTLSLRLARYGVPAIIVVFYFTAARQFGYTPESAFMALGQVAGVGAASAGTTMSPLWFALLSAARSAGLDPLLAAKMLSLVFASVSILAAFLLSVEILRDRFLAFAAALMFALQPWLTQAAIAGHPLALGTALVLGALFFLQRNEYPVAAIFIGLSTLVFWQAAFLLPVVTADALFNTPEKRTGIGRAIGAAVTTAGVCALWVVVALTTGNGIIPLPPPFSELGEQSAGVLIVYVLPAAGAVAGLVLLLLRGRDGLRVCLALLPVVAAAIVLMLAASTTPNQELRLVALPLLFGLGLFGLRIVLERFGQVRWLYPLTFLLAGVMLVQSQVALYGRDRTRMLHTEAENEELAGIAAWIRAHAGPGEGVACDRPATLAYLAGRPVERFPGSGATLPGFLVLPRPPAPGALPLYRLPVPVLPGIFGSGYTVWRSE